MTQGEYHELQLRRLALALDDVNPVAAGVARDAANYIQSKETQNEPTPISQ